MRIRRYYSNEFKASAVRLVIELGYSCKRAGEELDCNAWTIRDWVRAARASAAAAESPAAQDAEKEFRKLRDENARLRLENEILKKAAAYFAKESL